MKKRVGQVSGPAFELQLIEFLELENEVGNHVGQDQLQENEHDEIMTSFSEFSKVFLSKPLIIVRSKIKLL